MEARRPRRTDRREASGYTILEVLVALLLSGVIISSVFSVALTSKASSGKSDRQLVAVQAARQITVQLRNFMTGCSCNFSTGVCDATSCTIAGPNTARSGVATWYFNSPSASPAVTDSLGEVYALTYGAHKLTGYMPPWFESAPYNARLTYTVKASPTASMPQVDVAVNWTEP